MLPIKIMHKPSKAVGTWLHAPIQVMWEKNVAQINILNFLLHHLTYTLEHLQGIKDAPELSFYLCTWNCQVFNNPA